MALSPLEAEVPFLAIARHGANNGVVRYLAPCGRSEAHAERSIMKALTFATSTNKLQLLILGTGMCLCAAAF